MSFALTPNFDIAEQRVGFISFGGPTGQIAIMQTELVEKKRWISQSRFLHALNFCMLLPGPEASPNLTLRHLFTHTAGLWGHWGDREIDLEERGLE